MKAPQKEIKVVIRNEGEARRQSEVVEQKERLSYSPEQIQLKKEEADLSGQQRYNTQRKHKPFEPKFAKRTIEETENTDPNKLQVKKARQPQQTLDPHEDGVERIPASVNPRSSSNPREKLLPESRDPMAYTLVLDLDETLVHYDHKHRHFKVRPFAIMFLREMAKYFEVVIFTAALQDYADSILNAMDKEHLVAHRLYRNSTRFRAGTYLKDLGRLGRDLNRCLIVDNMEDNFQCQPDNGIPIRSWYSDPQDRELEKLMPFLKSLVTKQVPDVRPAVRHFKQLQTQQ